MKTVRVRKNQLKYFYIFMKEKNHRHKDVEEILKSLVKLHEEKVKFYG